MSLPSINFLHLMVSEIQPGQTFSRRPPAHPDTMGENNTPTAIQACGVKRKNVPLRSQRNKTSMDTDSSSLMDPALEFVVGVVDGQGTSQSPGLSSLKKKKGCLF